ncbi:MAG TPA: S8/S53 family peptidase [Tenuifilaceae bacterium]|nr:S8/S53 family peptidase [Tenuifilaceae bacterium]
MKRFTILATFIVASLFWGCSEISELNNGTQPEINPKALTGQEINAIIRETLEKEGDFNWNKVDAHVLWSAVVNGNNVLTIGYSDEPFTEANPKKAEDIKNELVLLITKLEKNSSSAKQESESILISSAKKLNFIDVYVTEFETIKKLRTNPNIRYMEPSGYSYFAYETMVKSDSGCNTDPETINSGDYTNASPGCQISWTFYKHNIPSAWSYSSGSGITVGLIDTGVSGEQSLLGSNFNNGYSAGRTIQKYGVYVNSIWPWSTKTDGPNDKCGHGTLMGATLAAPRNNRNLPVGVAYNCNLIAYRATGDVVLDGYHEQRGVSRALTELANRNEVKVISMSIGHIFTVNSIKDAVQYAYSKGKMIVAAGGTSTSFTNWAGVIFPANMDETVAATGITDGAGYTECDVCHKGSKIDFTVIMQRASDPNRRTVCNGFYENTRNYVGGSSVATATTAGIAALIWSKNPTWTRAQVYEKMKQSASLYPNRNEDFGWGSIDALAAVQ